MIAFRCCLLTSDPQPWRAGIDDTADDAMIDAMHRIRDELSSRTPMIRFIKMLRAAVQIDNRTLLGRDIQRCLLSNAADRLMLLVQRIDPSPWNTFLERLRDAWAVMNRRAVAVYIEKEGART